MRKFNIKGMSCAACSARVETAVNSLVNVQTCTVNLLTNSMVVTGKATNEDIIAAVQNAGYSASLLDDAHIEDTNTLKDTQTPILKRRLIYSLGFLAVLMYISMGHTMWGFPLPRFMQNNVLIAVLEMLLALTVMIINRQFFINGFKSIIHRAPNMDTLVSLGSAAGFVYSTAVVVMMISGKIDLSHALHDLYFESSAMILALITLGKMLESRAKGKTTNALKSLMDLSPKTATVIKNGKEIIITIEQVSIGDIFIVKPGESIAVDGIVIDGFSAVDESMLSGESIPIEKSVNSKVSAGTINRSGFLKCKAVKVGKDTAISQIIKMVSDAAATKAPIAKVADKISGIFVPIVLGIAIITIVVWLILGQTIGFALARGISVLVISCPCALGLATPVAIMVGSGKGAKNGILFKNAIALEQAGKLTAVALDKTGTITEGKPSVTDIAPLGITETELLKLAFSLEKHSEHPIAKAIVNKAKENGIDSFPISEFNTVAGNGLYGKNNDSILKGGNLSFIGDCVPTEFISLSENYANEGKTPVFFSKNSTFCGVIAVADTIKPDSAKAVKELQNMGLSVIMITGDNSHTANALGKAVGVDEIYSEILPDGKQKIIWALKQKNTVAMVGDGVNDAPALACADIGIAIGSGTDVAIDSADIVLMKNSLLDVSAAIRLSRATLKIIHQNLFWAFLYNCLGIPLAAGVFISLLGWQLNPMFGAAAMSLSSFCVVSNALRLNLFDILSNKKDKKIKFKEKQQMSVKTTLKIDGMMCPHCEARVKDVLQNLDGVLSAEVSHKDGTAIVESNKEIDQLLKQTVENQGYKVTDLIK
ncbi:MAG: heavy metal translocating P-type ATPase [Ruminococcaceae bacterium]|nr:heavy metal translocating P-type ATPase [Oscillospiraceae bacterium]